MEIKNFSCSVEQAPIFYCWLTYRGGLARWKSADLSDPSKSWTTPVLNKEGKPTEKSYWKMESAPSEICTRADDVDVVIDREVKRFHVAIRQGSGLKIVLTPGSERRLYKALEAAGKGSHYEFDYDTQEAVIYQSTMVTSLTSWVKEHPKETEDALAAFIKKENRTDEA